MSSTVINITTGQTLTEERFTELSHGVLHDALDLSDASTIINIPLLKRTNKRPAKRKHESEDEMLKVIDEGESAADNELSEPQVEISQEDTEQVVHRVDKVVGWLRDAEFESRHKETRNLEEIENVITDSWLYEDLPNPKIFSKNVRRVRVFLLEIEPNPYHELLDFVSGYCYDGCKKFYTYSTILWSKIDTYEVPLCPRCDKPDIEKELKLMFKVKLHVMDHHGMHSDLNVWKEHAELFFGCSAADFLRKPVVREATVSTLRNHTLANTLRQKYTPLLDVNLVCIKNFLFVVESSLKQMNKPVNTYQI